MYYEINRLFDKEGIRSGAFSLFQDLCYASLDRYGKESDKEAREIYVIANAATNEILNLIREDKKNEQSI